MMKPTRRTTKALADRRLAVMLGQREALKRSLQAPHAETSEWAELGLRAWFEGLPKEAASDLVDVDAGTRVTWVPDAGWAESSD